jgi:hypothetical protein
MNGNAELRRVEPELRPLVAEALACLAQSHHRWAGPLGWVLRTRWVRTARLPWRMQGFTFAVLPVIWLDRAYVEQCLNAGPERRGGVLQTLLHESAHQLGAVWPEWRNWLGDRRHYGPERNAADAISESIMRECYRSSRYADREISYQSPLCRLGLIKR